MYARIVSFVVATTLLLMPAYAVGQDVRPGQAYRGLFGPNTVTAGEALTVQGAIGAGWDSNLFLAHRDDALIAGTPIVTPNTTALNSGTYSQFSGGVGYLRNGDKLQFEASESSSARRYPDYPLTASHGAAARLSWSPTKRISFSSTHQFVYQPWQTFASFPALFGMPLRFDHEMAPNQAFASVEGAYRAYMTSSSFTTQLSRQSSLMAGYSYQLSTYNNSAAFVGPLRWDIFAVGDGRLTNQSGLVRFNRGVTRNLGWHAGYGYSDARYSGDVRRYRGHTLDVGIDYTRALSITRRTTFSFSTGAIAVEQPDQAGGYRRYDVTALATLNRQIGRTWNASATYMRNVEYLETARVPYFYDGVVLQLEGLISRRTGFHSAAGATYGDLGIDRDRHRRDRFDTEYANVGVAFGISRHLAVNTDYVFYMYSLNRLGISLPGAGPRLHRHDVIVSLSAWAPVFERRRKSNVAR
jgi:hypothetical protein